MIKKVLVILLIALVFWQIMPFVKNNVNPLSVKEIFSMEMFLSQKMDPSSIVENSLEEVIVDLEQKWGEELKINVRPKAEKNEILGENNTKPTVTFLYDSFPLNGKEVRNFVGFIFDRKYGNNSQTKQKTKKTVYLYKGNFKLNDYLKLKNEFPKISYSFEELRFIRDSGTVVGMFRSLFLKDKRSNKSLAVVSHRFPLNRATEVCAKYFCGKNSSLCQKEAFEYKARFLFLLLTFFSLLFSACFLFRVNLQLMFAQLLNLVGDAALFFRKIFYRLSVWRQRKIEEKILKSRNQEMERKKEEKEKEIFKKATILEEELKSFMGEEEFAKDHYLNTLLRVAKGFGKKIIPLKNRENSLELGVFSLERIRKRKKEPASSTVIKRSKSVNDLDDSKKEKKMTKRIERRESLFCRLAVLFPEIEDVDFVSWKNNEIERLISIVENLGEINRDLVYLLFTHPEFEAIAKKGKYSLRELIDGNRLDEIEELLGSEEIREKISDENEEAISLPDYLEVVIVAGDRINGSRREEIKNELLSLGSRNVIFYDAGKVRQTIAASENDQSKFLVLTYLPHHATDIIKNSGRRAIFIDALNPKVFAMEVAKGYKKAL